MADYMRVLKWPVIGWVVVDLIFLAMVLVSRGTAGMLTPASLSPLLLGFGAWAGYKMVDLGGKFYDGIVAGVVVGVVCGVLTLVLLAVLGMMAEAVPEFTFNLGMNVAGAVLGAGYASTK